MKHDNFLNTPESLLHILGYHMDKRANEILSANFGINFTQFQILMMVCDKKDANQKFLAGCIGISEAGISKTILELVKRNLLQTLINEENRRERNLKLTSESEKLLESAYAILREESKKLFSKLTKTEFEQFQTTLNKLINHFQ